MRTLRGIVPANGISLMTPGRDMTVLALAEHIERCLLHRADDVLVEKSHTRVTFTATVGNQQFVVTRTKARRTRKNQR